jgi:hypothetical protein
MDDEKAQIWKEVFKVLYHIRTGKLRENTKTSKQITILWAKIRNEYFLNTSL